MRTGFMLAAGVALAAGGCSAGADKGTATAAVAEFRQLSDAGRFADIWRGGAAELKASTSEAELVRVLSGLQSHYGNFRSASETNFAWNSSNGIVQVTLEYASEFERGRANERFIYRIDNGAASLVGYNRSAANGAAAAEGNSSAEANASGDK
jgi:hypothetical protein